MKISYTYTYTVSGKKVKIDNNNITAKHGAF